MKVAMGRVAWLVCVVSLSGCALFSPVNVDTQRNVLNNVPLDLPSETTHPATLLVLTPQIAPAYAKTQMAYSIQPYQVAYFTRNAWAETPSQMIQPLVVQTLRSTHYFSEVLSAPYFGRHTFALRTELLQLEQDFTSDPATLRLTMRVALSRAATNQVIATKEWSVSQPMSQKTPYAGVVAANEAIQNLLRELARFVIENAG